MKQKQSGKLNIIVAVYGLEIVTEKIKALISKEKIETLDFNVTNEIIGIDGWRGQVKSITVLYNYDGGQLQVAAAKEKTVLKINPESISETNRQINKNEDVHVLAATYGPQNVTEIIDSLVTADNKLLFTVGNNLFGDTWAGVAKTLVVVLGYKDIVTDVKIFAERENCNIDIHEPAHTVK